MNHKDSAYAQLEAENERLKAELATLRVGDKEAEVARARELETLSAVLDGIDDVIYIADPETYELLHVNETFTQTWGKDVLGKKCYRVIQGRDAPCPFCTNDKILGEFLGQTHVWEFQNEVTKDWYRCADKAIQWPDGRTVRFEMASDITSSKRAEMELLHERDFSNALLDALPGVFYALDPEGRFQRWNENFSRVTGYSHKEFESLNALELFTGAGKQLIAERIGRVFEDGEASAEVDLNTKDGTAIPYFFTGKKIVMGGEPRLIGMGIDISAQWQATKELNTIFEMSSDMICIADINKGTFEKVNPAFSTILGHDESELLGVEFLSFNHPDDIEPTNKVVEEQLKAGNTVFNFQNRYRCKDGSYKWLEWVSAPDAEQGLTFAIARDVTERKQHEAELSNLNEDLARSNKELEQFAYVASHDLQEPLRMVASYTQLLAQRYEGQLDAKADKYIGYAVDGAKRMQGLINDLLAFSRVGTRGESLEPIVSGEVVAEVLQSLEKKIEETGAQIVVGDLPTVMADRTQLGQLFQNLISNAIKFCGEETPRVQLNATKQGSGWEFCVADNGIGIDNQFFDRIFVIFQRLHGRGEYSGSGIGLSIVKKIVERHGGRIRIESTPGAGSCFLFDLSAV